MGLLHISWAYLQFCVKIRRFWKHDSCLLCLRHWLNPEQKKQLFQMKNTHSQSCVADGVKMRSAVKKKRSEATVFHHVYLNEERCSYELRGYIPLLKPLRCSIRTSLITAEATESGNVWTQQKARPLLTESLSQSDLRSASLLVRSWLTRPAKPHHHCSAETNVLQPS